MKERAIVEAVLAVAFEEVERANRLEEFRLKRSTGLRRCSIFSQYTREDAETLAALERELSISVDELRAMQKSHEPTTSRRRRSDGEDACFELVAVLKRRYTWNERTIIEDRCNRTVPWPKLSEKLRQGEPLLRLRYSRLLDDVWATQKKLIATVLFFYYRIDTFSPG